MKDKAMRKRNTKPADRKLTKKEQKTIEPLYLTYEPIRRKLTEEEKAEARRLIQELF